MINLIIKVISSNNFNKITINTKKFVMIKVRNISYNNRMNPKINKNNYFLKKQTKETKIQKYHLRFNKE